MKTINTVMPFQGRFLYHMIYKFTKSLGFLTTFQSYFEIILMNAFQASSAMSEIQCVLNKCQLLSR